MEIYWEAGEAQQFFFIGTFEQYNDALITAEGVESRDYEYYHQIILMNVAHYPKTPTCD